MDENDGVGSNFHKSLTYEEVATYLLDTFAKEFGLDRVESKQTVDGQLSGTEWTIDAKGVREPDGGIMVVECRRYTTSKAKQEHLAALAFRIIDLEALGGIYVSPLGLQAGARKVAAATNIISVELTPESTPEHFVISFLGKFRAGASMTLFVKTDEQSTSEHSDEQPS